MPGPPPKLNRTRPDKTKVTEVMHWDGVIRGFDLPDEALGPDEQWHPMVRSWWEAFRQSPQAALLSSDLQWETLLGAMRTYQDLWNGQARGRTLKSAEFRQILSNYLVTPGDARRQGIEFVSPQEADEDADSPTGDASVSDLSARRARLVNE
jgi:hypothetical protein